MMERVASVRDISDPGGPFEPVGRAPAGAGSRRHGSVERYLLLAGIVGASAIALARPATGVLHAVATAVAIALFGLLMWLEASSPRLRIGAVAAVSVALLVLAVAAPSRDSRDVWAYAMYGRVLAAHHANPYAVAPVHFAHDPLYHLVSANWRRSVVIYGPLFVGVSAAVAWIAGNHPTALRVGFQGVAALAILACLLLIWRRTRDPRAVAFLGLNPITTLTVVNGGHPDALIGLAILCAVVAAERGSVPLAGAAAGLAALVKAPLLLPLAALVVWTWSRRGFARAAVTGTVAVITVLAGYALVLPSAVRALRGATGIMSPFSVWKLPRWLQLVFIPGPRGAHSWLASAFRAGASIALPATLIVAVVLVIPKLRADSPRWALAASVLAYLLIAPYVLPWYTMWILPALAVAWRSRTAWGAQGVALLLLAQYLPRQGIYRLPRFPPSAPKIITIGGIVIDLGLLATLLIASYRRSHTTEIAAA
jgi:Glycosyltransferase family 87